MASVGASAALGADVSLKPGASLTPFMAQPCPPPSTGPTHRPPGEQHLPPPRTPSFPPGRPLVLPAWPRTSLVAGDAGQGTVGTGAYNIMAQVRSERRRPQPSLTQAPLYGSAPGAACGGAVCPAPLFLEATAVENIMPASAFGGTQAGDGGWCPSLPPQATPPAAQLIPIVPGVDPGTGPHGASREGGLAASLSKASLDASDPKSVYEDFRRWRRFKALARGHLPQSPDVDALCCFLMPELRPLSRLKPTMTLEEGIGRAMQEWQRKSHCDRRVYFEMAEKFMAFEAEEQMQAQKLQLKKGMQTQPLPAPLRPGPRGPPAPVVGAQPAPAPRKAVPTAQLPWETESHNGIPPEAEQEDMDLTEALPMGAPGREWADEVKEWLQDEGLLSYLDQLCSQEDFVTQVEEVIDPQFLQQLNSPDAQLDLLALAEELEQEEGLIAAQLAERRLLASEEGACRHPRVSVLPCGTHVLLSLRAAKMPGGVTRAPSWGSVPQSARQRLASRPLRGAAQQTPPAPGPRLVLSLRGLRSSHRSGLDAAPLLPRATGLRTLHGHPGPPAPPERPLWSGRRWGQRPGPVRTRRTSPAWPSSGPPPPPAALRALSEPWPCLGAACPGGRGPRGAAQARPLQRGGLSRASPAARQPQKRALGGGPAHAEKTPRPGAGLGVWGRPALAPGPLPSSQPHKRKREPSDPGSWRKRHCSQYGAEGSAPHCPRPEGPRPDGTWLSPRGAMGSFSWQG
ncbi:unnamed protein product [Pipistrellus nathusii]|uniref:Nuclear Testis protein N-terminal domain-containing protein n=1 Tax=Pipistrellus nathusii TaxID=59473 RepID=A0ABN9Z6Y6_PIPNA